MWLGRKGGQLLDNIGTGTLSNPSAACAAPGSARLIPKELFCELNQILYIPR